MDISGPILAEDSTINKLAPSLERILKDLDASATHHDYLVALLIVFLTESGFNVSATSCRTQCETSVYIPKDWKVPKTGVYDINFRLQRLPDVNCKLIAIPSGDTLILNFYPSMEGKNIYAMAVQSLKYVNPFSSDLCGRYMNLREISHRFKNTLATPVRTDVLLEAGLTCPSLPGLPTELKLRILGMLDVCTIRRLAQCSTEFHELCLELLEKNFHK